MTHASATPARPSRLSHTVSNLGQRTHHEPHASPRLCTALARLTGLTVMGDRQQPRRKSKPAALVIVADRQVAGIRRE